MKREVEESISEGGRGRKGEESRLKGEGSMEREGDRRGRYRGAGQNGWGGGKREIGREERTLREGGGEGGTESFISQLSGDELRARAGSRATGRTPKRGNESG